MTDKEVERKGKIETIENDIRRVKELSLSAINLFNFVAGELLAMYEELTEEDEKNE
jgi:hypothetical protein